jgi:hypothetical protein
MKLTKTRDGARRFRGYASRGAAALLLASLLAITGLGGAGKPSVAPAQQQGAEGAACTTLKDLAALQQEVAAANLAAVGSLADAALCGSALEEEGEVPADPSAAAIAPSIAAASQNEEEEELSEDLLETDAAGRAAGLPAPAGLKVTQYGRDYLLEWMPVSHPQVVGYNVYRSFFANPRINLGRRLNSQPLGSPTFFDTTVRNRNRKQYYRVASVNQRGRIGPPSESVAISPWLPDTNPPAAVSAVDAAFLDDGLSVAWEASNREPDFNGYNLYLSDVQGRLGSRLNGTPLKDTLYFAAGQTAGEQPRYLAVRSVDTSGNESLFSQVVPVIAPPRIYDDLSPELAYDGFWKAERYEGAYGGTITVANDAGAGVELAFRGRAVRLFVSRYWTCGTADIYLDGRLAATVDLYSESTDYSVQLFHANALKPGDHVIRMVVRGTTESSRRENPTGYHFCNLDFLVVH